MKQKRSKERKEQEKGETEPWSKDSPLCGPDSGWGACKKTKGATTEVRTNDGFQYKNS